MKFVIDEIIDLLEDHKNNVLPKCLHIADKTLEKYDKAYGLLSDCRMMASDLKRLKHIEGVL